MSLSLHQVRHVSSLADAVKQRLRSLSKPKVPTPPLTQPLPPKKKPSGGPTPINVLKHRQAMKEAFPSGWNPPRKLSRDAMDGLRALHTHDPVQFSTPVLAEKFRISPEAVSRILKSKWQPSEERRTEMTIRERRSRMEFTTQRRAKEWEEAKRAKHLSLPQRKNDRFDLV